MSVDDKGRLVVRPLSFVLVTLKPSLVLRVLVCAVVDLADIDGKLSSFSCVHNTVSAIRIVLMKFGLYLPLETYLGVLGSGESIKNCQ